MSILKSNLILIFLIFGIWLCVISYYPALSIRTFGCLTLISHRTWLSGGYLLTGKVKITVEWQPAVIECWRKSLLMSVTSWECQANSVINQNNWQTNSPDQRRLHNRPAKQTDEDSQTVFGLFSVCQYDLEDLYVLAFSTSMLWETLLEIHSNGC